MKKTRTATLSILRAPQPVEGARVGRVTDVDDSGQVFVDYLGSTLGPVPARHASSITPASLRKAVAHNLSVILLFEENDPLRPIVLDILPQAADPAPLKADEVLLDGKRITLDAEDEVVIRCGKGSITLRKDGKIVINGTHIVSRSAGPHKIKGASVNIN